MKSNNLKQSPIVRKKIIFSGKVQGVAFRYETYTMADELNLTGWVRNKNNGHVELEIQGREKEISLLVSHLKSLKRAHVTNVEIDEISVINGELDFEIKS